MTETEAIEALCWRFANDLRERLKFIKLCHKGDLDGDDDNLLWHFTRLSTLSNILVRRELWLSDLAFSNDENEIVYGLSRAPAVVEEVSAHWASSAHAAAVRKIAESAIRRFGPTHHVFAFCFSMERDTAQHWNGYGGGLHIIPESGNPHVAIGFDAQSLFHPIELSEEVPSTYVINTVNGDNSADSLARYWAIEARKVLERLDAGRLPLSAARVCDALERMLVLSSALVKNEGWRDEHEYRLIYMTEKFGEEDSTLPPRPDGRGRYVPLKWSLDKLPIRAVVPHPLADVGMVERSVQGLPGGGNISIISSTMKPRPKGNL